ncbi:beta-lactamase family protein [Nocardia otitidiscaviarum]|uniref:Beta-lactamase family protein n=1 Tax=Nocardia otitidiscaviarum TaxID=1823 RepID=A0A516NHT5_9NOCA|nr:serine hydrolase domain-containing protein [Nocardia otitidiscaviarum]MCP9618679.1 beta-lactamase family protein [Nocardia otitidiscaviarum]QDP78471.1 beta-lactamase family protein [Nocardia otitidiscaviarum]
MDAHLRSEVELPAGVEGRAAAGYASAARLFARMFAGKRGNGAGLAVYHRGAPVLNIWAGSADAGGTPWTRDTGAMVYSASKGVTATVMHRLADRGLIDYHAPIAEYWPEFGANGKGDITIRDVMTHRSGLSALPANTWEEILDHELMERRLAAAAPDRLRGKPIYHALTQGWILAGVARAVTGLSMAELYRTEVAEPLGVDGIHLGRPPADAPTITADLVGSAKALCESAYARPTASLAARLPGPFRAPLRSIYFPGLEAAFAGDEPPILTTQLPAGNAVCTADGLAKMYSALACDGMVDGERYLSHDTVRTLEIVQTIQPDRTLIVPCWHLGYHIFPSPRAPRGYGHLGAFGSGGWADPASGISIGFVHNRMSVGWVSADMTLLAWLIPAILAGARGSVATAAAADAATHVA